MPKGKGKIKQWTIDEDQLLISNASKMTTNELAELVDATYIQTRCRCQQLGLMPRSKYRGWTIQELQIARSNPRQVAARILNRSLPSIDSRLRYARKQSINI